MTAKVRDQNRRTPPWLFKLLQRELKLKFALDAAASKVNALCRRYYTEEDDGLLQPWKHPTYCNPPFKRMDLWVAKAYNEAYVSDIVTCVVGPTGCAQKWFQSYARQGTVYAPDDRIVYYSSDTGQPTHGADRDTMVYVFGPGFWNESWRTQFRVLPLAVRGLVITKRKAT